MDEASAELMRRAYLDESEEHLCALEELLSRIEAGGEELSTDELFRHMHSLKGAASSLGYAEIASVCHVLESALDAVRSGDGALDAAGLDALLKGLDLLRRMNGRLAAGEPLPSPETEPEWPLLQGLVAAVCAAESPAPRSTPGKAEADGPVQGRSIRVMTDKLDRLLDLAAEMVTARERFSQLVTEVGGPGAARLAEAHADSDRLYAELQEHVMQARMVPLGPLLRRQARVVREAARKAGKAVRLEISDEHVEADTSIIELLHDSLMHMIRNAVDHGIEDLGGRLDAGKDVEGCVRLAARHDNGSILVTLEDDGGGLNRARIAQVARERGLSDAPEQLEDEALFQLIFAPGFSTSTEVTELSGRGVGMDAVRRNIEALRGTISLASVKGQGTRISLRLPLTLGIIEGFGVGAGDQTFLVPMENVSECLELRGMQPAGALIDLRGAAVPLLRLRDLFGLAGRPGRRESVVVVQHEATRVALAVDALLGASQTVFKPLGRLFRAVPGIAGSAVLGTGRVALILDVPGLFKLSEQRARTKPKFEAGGVT